MTDLDVERITECEIEELKKELQAEREDIAKRLKFGIYVPHDKMNNLLDRLIDALELRIEQLKDKIDSYNINDDRPLHHSFGAENND